MDSDKVNNFTPGKTLRQYKPGDTLYISKIIGGFQYTYLCEFSRIEHGVVWAKVISNSHGRNMGGARPGDMETARAASCYAWKNHDLPGVPGSGGCQWFRDGLDKPAGIPRHTAA